MQDQVFAIMQRYLRGPFRHLGGGNVLTKCPFHKGGEEFKPSFSFNTEKAIFHCFSCHIAGDISYFLELMGLPESAREAELSGIKPILEKNRETYRLEKQNTFINKDPFKAEYVLPESILGVYDWCPTKLVEKGFSISLLKDLDIGFDRNGQRIMYPLRDLYGNLAGFSGGAQYQWQEPKYKVYQGRRKVNGHWTSGDFGDWFDEQFPDFRCENHDFLWNFNRIYRHALSTSDPNATVFVVEGFKACMWMLQAGFTNTVALMGSYISERQQLMLHRLNTNVVLFLDNDKAGREATVWIGEYLWRPMRGRISVVTYPGNDENTQPDNYPPEVLYRMVNERIPFGQYVYNELQKNPILKQKVERKRKQLWQ